MTREHDAASYLSESFLQGCFENSEFQRLMKIKSSGIGWKSKIIVKRATSYISINKLVVDGCSLEKGDELYSYLAEDENGRKIIVMFLDGGKKANKDK